MISIVTHYKNTNATFRYAPTRTQHRYLFNFVHSVYVPNTPHMHRSYGGYSPPPHAHTHYKFPRPEYGMAPMIVGHLVCGYLVRRYLVRGHLVRGYLVCRHLVRGHLVRGYLVRGHLVRGYLECGYFGHLCRGRHLDRSSCCCHVNDYKSRPRAH